MSRIGRMALAQLHLRLGSFYRDRTGHKYVCIDEGHVDQYVCLRIFDRAPFVYKADGAFPEDGAQDLVEEVQPTAPLFVDPTALVEGINYDTMWERVQVMPSGIEITKFSPKTAVRDVTMANKDMPSDIRNKLDRDNVGKLWRARLNRQTRARYEWDIDKAVALVMTRAEKLD